MQERFISPRGLHFGPQQLFWECREADASELNPYGVKIGEPGLKPKYEGARLRYYSSCSGALLYDISTTVGLTRGYSGLYRVVEAYSDCALTVPSDKVVAFSAILKQCSASYEEEMVVGMRRRCLENDLLWVVDEDVELSSYETYIAPSWPWASAKGKTRENSLQKAPALIQVEDYKLDYVTEDTTAAIRGGWLRLSGSLKRVKLLRRGRHISRLGHWVLAVDGVKVKCPRLGNPWAVFLDAPAEHFDDDK
ncbi:hypothetical protein ACJZ2D_016491 [Fusarium nematophilum]